MILPNFNLGALQSLCDILGDTGAGFTGSQIGKLLAECNINDPMPGYTKRIRLFEALKSKQEQDRCANNVVAFIEHAMTPARHHNNVNWFDETRTRLNRVLAFEGYQLGENGKLKKEEKVKTLAQAQARASRLKEKLIARGVHPAILLFCREELVADNYFHSVFEATKSVAEIIRNKTGLTSDGADLVDEAFSFRSGIPYLALNTLRTESEQSEQSGFMNLLKGLFGTFRNTLAHAPKISWQMNEQDALDILSLISLIHRKLDSAICAKK